MPPRVVILPVRLNPESIIDVVGQVVATPNPVESCTQQDVELAGAKVRLTWRRPEFSLYVSVLSSSIFFFTS